MRRLLMAAIVFAAFTCLASLALAQVTDGNLVGTVTDPTGASVPNANIDVQNVATGVHYTAKTGASGNYRLNNLPVGTYRITANAPGFTAATLDNVQVRLNQTSTANMSMAVGQVATSVEVTEAPAVIDTTTAQVQSTYESRQIVDMPIIENPNGMFGALNLALLSSGVASNGGVGQGTGPSVGGQRPMNNNFMVEGVDNNNKTVTGPLVYVPTEATAEFTLLQNQFGAEFGHSSGGQFNTIVKSGTNEIHGSIYEYFQNRNLNAMDESFKRQGYKTNPRFDANRLGATIGGPIVKNKLFYFGNFEYAPVGQFYTVSPPAYGPTAEGFRILDSTSGISQANWNLYKQYVAPAPVANADPITVNGQTIPVGILPIAGSQYTNQYAVVGSLDYNMSDADQLRGRIIYNKWDSLDTYATLPKFWTNLPQRFYLASISEFHNFSPNITNELRLAFNRFSQYYIVPPFKVPGLDAFPNLTFDDLGMNLGPDPNAPQFAVQNTYQLTETLNWTKGNHTIKIGFDGRNYISPQHFIQRERGDYEYDTFELYLLDEVPGFAERNLGNTSYYGNQWATYLFGNDDWRIRPNLSLNLGLRWERTTVPLSFGWQSLNAISNVPGLIEFRNPKTQNKNFAPRIGIAYSPGSSGNTSIRAGFGMAYDVLFDNIGSTAYPPQLSATFDAGDYPDIFKAPFLAHGGIYPGSIAAGGTLSQADARAATSSYIPDQEVPYSISWNLGVQHVFAQNYTFEARYLGTRGVHLITQNRLGRTSLVTPSHSLPTYLQRPSQAELDALPLTLTDIRKASNNPIYGPYGFTSAITGFMPWGNSIYHGLALQLNRRFSRGVQLVGSYTWSHNIDDSTATHFSTVLTPRRPQDFRNLRVDRASSALDRRHRFTFNALWEVPWFKNSNWLAKNLIGNWRYVISYTAESPEYTTPQSGIDANLNGDNAGDRSIINPTGVWNKGSGVTALKNSAGQTVAYVANDPTARYIQAGAGAYANAGRNTLPAIGINNFDMSLAKRFSFTERAAFEIRADASNVFNHAQYTPGYINSVRLTSFTNTRSFMLVDNASFGRWDTVFSNNPRTLQLAARITF